MDIIILQLVLLILPFYTFSLTMSRKELEISELESDLQKSTTNGLISIEQDSRKKLATLYTLRNRLDKFLDSTKNDQIYTQNTELLKVNSNWKLFWKNFLPHLNLLKRLSEIRRNLEPNLKNFLTTKFNNFLMSFIPYGSKFGISSILLNSMKISDSFDSQWNYIENFLDTSSLNEFFRNLPEIILVGPSRRINKEISDNNRIENLVSNQDSQSHDQHDGLNSNKNFGYSNHLKFYNRGRSQQSNDYEQEHAYRDKNSDKNLYDRQRIPLGNENNFFFQKPKENHEDNHDYPNQNLLIDKMRIFDNVVKNKRRGGGKYLNLKDPVGFGEMWSARHSHYISKAFGDAHAFLDPFSILGGLAFLTFLALLFQQMFNVFGRVAERQLSGFEDEIFGHDITWILSNLINSKEFPINLDYINQKYKPS